MGTQLYPVAIEAHSKKEILAKYCKPKKQTKKKSMTEEVVSPLGEFTIPE